MSKQTCDALVVTLRCTAFLIENLLSEGYNYILTARFQIDPLELRFSKYRQMSGGRFLLSLREVETSERILATKSLLKESISVWNEYVRPDQTNAIAVNFLKKQLNEIVGDLEYCSLKSNAEEVADVVSGYVAKKLINRSQWVECQNSLTTTGSLQAQANSITF